MFAGQLASKRGGAGKNSGHTEVYGNDGIFVGPTLGRRRRGSHRKKIQRV